jgi:S-formylglutathione hydrolase FrmB
VVFLLDAFNAGDTVRNWVTAGSAMNSLGAKGISWSAQLVVVSMASTSTGSRTAAASGRRLWPAKLPDWLATNKVLAPGGHRVVGAAQGGVAALMMTEFHPGRFRYAGSMSGFLYPSNTTVKARSPTA